jgi:hypothetical protein
MDQMSPDGNKKQSFAPLPREPNGRNKSMDAHDRIPPDLANSSHRCPVTFTGEAFRNFPLRPDQEGPSSGRSPFRKRGTLGQPPLLARSAGPTLPPASRPHRRKTRPPPTTPRALAPGVLVMWSKARRSSRDATSRQRGVHRDGHIAGPKGPDQVHHRRLLPLLPAVTPLMLPGRCCPPPPPKIGDQSPPPTPVFRPTEKIRRRGTAGALPGDVAGGGGGRRMAGETLGGPAVVPRIYRRLCSARRCRRGPLYLCLFWREEDSEPAMAHLRRGRS